jgi:FkbM family methyltransferase
MRASAKTAMRVVTGWPIRVASYLFPVTSVFTIALAARRYHSKLSERGGPQIVLKILDHCFCSLRPAIVEVPFQQFRFSVRLNDPLHYSILLGLHEREVLECLRQQLKPGMTVFDVGANLGYFSMVAGELVGRTGRIISVEPDPRVVEVLAKNVEANGFQNATVVRAAAYNSSGEVSLGCAPATSWSGIDYKRPTTRIAVRALTLDSISDQLGLDRVDLVKIDVEGAETVVLEGMSDMLVRYRPQVLLELHGEYSNTKAHPAVHLLREYKYTVQEIAPRHVLGLPAERGASSSGGDDSGWTGEDSGRQPTC